MNERKPLSPNDSLMAGYSATTLQKKLGIKPAMRVVFINAPSTYRDDLGALPSDVRLLSRPGKNMNFVHLFCGIESKT